MSAFTITVEGAGITIDHQRPLTRAEARQLAIRVLQAATAGERVLRRPPGVDEQLRERDG